MKRGALLRRALCSLVGASALALSLPLSAAADTPPSGERTFGNVSIEPAYDYSTGGDVYLLTPNRLAPLGASNPINNVNPHAVAPLYIVVYPPGTSFSRPFDCAGVPGNCPDHDGAIAGIATSTYPAVYGGDASAVPGHDHLVGVAKTNGDFNVPWHVYVELFTSPEHVTRITTLNQLQDAWRLGYIDPMASGQGFDTGITFVCAIVSAHTYQIGTPVS